MKCQGIIDLLTGCGHLAETFHGEATPQASAGTRGCQAAKVPA